MLADIGYSGLLLLLNLNLGVIEQTGTLLTSLFLGFLYNGIACLSSLLQHLGLLFACFLKNGFTFLLDILKAL